MGKLLRILLIVLAAVVVLVIAAVIIIPQFIDPNDYKDMIVAEAKKATGRDITLGGDIELSFWPVLGVNVAEVAVANPPDFEQQTMASLDEAAVGVQVMPLLSGEIAVSELVIKGLTVDLVRRKDGTTNWDDLAELGKKEKPAEPAPEPAPPGEQPPFEIALSEIKVIDANLSYADRQSGQAAALSGLDVTLMPAQDMKSFDFDMAFGLEAEPPQLTSDFTMAFTLVLPEGDQLPSVKDLDMVMDILRYQGEPMPEGSRLEATGQIIGGAQSIAVEDFKVNAFSIPLALQADVKGVGTQSMTADASLEVDEFSPRSILNRFKMQQALAGFSEDVFTSVRLALDLAYAPESITISNLDGKVDDITFDGKASVTGPKLQTFDFVLNTSALELDPYMPKTEDKPAEEPTEPGEPKPVSAPEAVKDYTGTGLITAPRISAQGFAAENVRVEMRLEDGVIRFDPVTMNVFKGDVKAALSQQLVGAKPASAVKLDLANLDLAELTQKVMGKKQLSGPLNIAVDLTTAGAGQKELMQNLNGTFSTISKGSTVHGYDLPTALQLIGMPFNMLMEKLGLREPEEKMMDVEILEVAFDVTDGIAKSKSIYFSTPPHAISAEATADLANQLWQEWGDLVVNWDAKTLVIPAQFKGPMTGTPDWRINWEAIFKQQLEQGVDVQKLKQSFGDVGGASSVLEGLKPGEGVAPDKIIEEGLGGLMPDAKAPAEGETDAATDTPEDRIKKGLEGLLPGAKKTEEPAQETQKTTEEPAPEQPAEEEQKSATPEEQIKEGLKGLFN